MTRFNSELAKTIFESNVEMNEHSYFVEVNGNHTIYKLTSKDYKLEAKLFLTVSDFCLDIRREDKVFMQLMKRYKDTTVGGFARSIYDVIHIIEAYDDFLGV